jgi:hypothetical protein
MQPERLGDLLKWRQELLFQQEDITKKLSFFDNQMKSSAGSSLADLIKWRQELVPQQQEIEKRLSYLAELIEYEEPGSSQGELIRLPSRAKTKQPRVRGVFAAARRAVDQLSGPFDKDQLLEKLESDAEFVDRKITASNIRNALRLLKKNGVIKVESEATATKSAKYVRAA